MSQLPSDQIVCSDCGTTFLFSSAEAAFFIEKGLTPPKRCKACRMARKERGGAAGGGFRGSAPREGFAGGAPRGERSDRGPMPAHEPSPWANTPWSREGAAEGGARRRPLVREGALPRGPGRAAPSHGDDGGARREGFPIVCKSCGAESTVPFRPVQGRDVFCRDCYRARAGT